MADEDEIFDLNVLSAAQFQQLLGAILLDQDFVVHFVSGGIDIARGVDIVATGSDGSRMFVMVTTRLDMMSSHQTIVEATRLKEQYGPDTQFVLATPSLATMASIEKLRRSNIELWDSQSISRKIRNIPRVRDAYQSLMRAESRFAASLDQFSPKPKEPEAAKVGNELSAIRRGRDHWRDYENVCSRILSDIFLPRARGAKAA